MKTHTIFCLPMTGSCWRTSFADPLIRLAPYCVSCTLDQRWSLHGASSPQHAPCLHPCDMTKAL